MIYKDLLPGGQYRSPFEHLERDGKDVTSVCEDKKNCRVSSSVERPAKVDKSKVAVMLLWIRSIRTIRRQGAGDVNLNNKSSRLYSSLSHTVVARSQDGFIARHFYTLHFTLLLYFLLMEWKTTQINLSDCYQLGLLLT